MLNDGSFATFKMSGPKGNSSVFVSRPLKRRVPVGSGVACRVAIGRSVSRGAAFTLLPVVWFVFLNLEDRVENLEGNVPRTPHICA